MRTASSRARPAVGSQAWQACGRAVARTSRPTSTRSTSYVRASGHEALQGSVRSLPGSPNAVFDASWRPSTPRAGCSASRRRPGSSSSGRCRARWHGGCAKASNSACVRREREYHRDMMRDMRGNAYKALGYVVFQRRKALIKRRYSNQLRIAGGSALVLVVGTIVAGICTAASTGRGVASYVTASGDLDDVTPSDAPPRLSRGDAGQPHTAGRIERRAKRSSSPTCSQSAGPFRRRARDCLLVRRRPSTRWSSLEGRVQEIRRELETAAQAARLAAELQPARSTYARRPSATASASKRSSRGHVRRSPKASASCRRSALALT